MKFFVTLLIRLDSNDVWEQSVISGLTDMVVLVLLHQYESCLTSAFRCIQRLFFLN